VVVLPATKLMAPGFAASSSSLLAPPSSVLAERRLHRPGGRAAEAPGFAASSSSLLAPPSSVLAERRLHRPGGRAAGGPLLMAAGVARGACVPIAAGWGGCYHSFARLRSHHGAAGGGCAAGCAPRVSGWCTFWLPSAGPNFET
jgi:hypothetical protein